MVGLDNPKSPFQAVWKARKARNMTSAWQHCLAFRLLIPRIHIVSSREHTFEDLLLLLVTLSLGLCSYFCNATVI